MADWSAAAVRREAERSGRRGDAGRRIEGELAVYSIIVICFSNTNSRNSSAPGFRGRDASVRTCSRLENSRIRRPSGVYFLPAKPSSSVPRGTRSALEQTLGISGNRRDNFSLGNLRNSPSLLNYPCSTMQPSNRRMDSAEQPHLLAAHAAKRSERISPLTEEAAARQTSEKNRWRLGEKGVDPRKSSLRHSSDRRMIDMHTFKR